MGKRSRDRSRANLSSTPSEGQVGPRQPCPCGSGRRYKNCHGREGGPAAASIVRRPFAGLAGECDIVAMRELVPAATVELELRADVVPDPDRSVRLCTLLPMAAPALVRQDGSIWLGLQVQHAFGDPSRELAAVLLAAYDREPGDLVGLTEAPGEGLRLQDLLAPQWPGVQMHTSFDFWISDMDDPDGSLAAGLQQADDAAAPTDRLTTVDAAYWTDAGTKEHLRWVMPHDEGELLDALARLHAAGESRLAEDSRLVGMFRAHGLLVPVWDLAPGTGSEALEDPAAEFAARLEEAMGRSAPLDDAERAARAGLANRQVTIR